MLSKIKGIFKRKKEWHKTHPEVRIVPAFTLPPDEFSDKPTTYYEFEDPNNLTLGRGQAAAVVLQEMSMCVTSAFLKAHTTAVKELLKNPKSIDVYKIYELNAQLEERNSLVIDSVGHLRAASVIYFDETEDPYGFDYAYAYKKIERWKKSHQGFFLQTPLKKLIPSLDWSEETLQNYLTISREVDKAHYQTVLDTLSQILSETEKNKEWWKRLKLEKSII